MRYAVLLPVVAMLSVMCGCTMLVEEEPPCDITLAELFAKMRKASDPQGLCPAATSYVLRQQLLNADENSRNQQYQVEVIFQKKPYFTKTTVFKSGEPYQTTLFNGQKAWVIDTASGKSQPITGSGLDLFKILDKIGNPAYSYADVFPNIKLSQTISGTTEYYKLICTSEQMESITLTVFINKNSYLTKKVELQMTGEDNGETINYSSYINEYALYQGVMMPETITVETNGVKSQYRTLEFKLNVDIPAQEFELPIPWYLKNIDAQPEKPSEHKVGPEKK